MYDFVEDQIQIFLRHVQLIKKSSVYSFVSLPFNLIPEAGCRQRSQALINTGFPDIIGERKCSKRESSKTQNYSHPHKKKSTVQIIANLYKKTIKKLSKKNFYRYIHILAICISFLLRHLNL